VNIDGILRVASNNAEQEEAVDWDYGGDAIGFNVTYLIDALANMSQDMVEAGGLQQRP
jgi:DNA polymerase-3 subunit beta